MKSVYLSTTMGTSLSIDIKSGAVVE